MGAPSSPTDSRSPLTRNRPYEKWKDVATFATEPKPVRSLTPCRELELACRVRGGRDRHLLAVLDLEGQVRHADRRVGRVVRVRDAGEPGAVERVRTAHPTVGRRLDVRVDLVE